METFNNFDEEFEIEGDDCVWRFQCNSQPAGKIRCFDQELSNNVGFWVVYS